MKLIIDIDEKDYNFIKSVKSIMKNSDTFQRISADLFKAVKDGEPLPDNHGDLTDRYDEGYADGYIDGSTGADWKGGAE